jgi:hypothetical protein
MSLYGYDLVYYMVVSSLGEPTGCARKLRWQTAGMFGEAAMAEPWDGVGKAAMLTLAVKPQWVRCKLDETIEQSCIDFLAHTLEVCKSARWYNVYLAI